MDLPTTKRFMEARINCKCKKCHLDIRSFLVHSGYSSLFSRVNTQEFETSEFGRLPPETVMNLEIHFKAFYIMVYNIYLP